MSNPTPSPAPTPALTPDEVEFYHRTGYVLYRRQLFDEQKLQQLTDIFEEHLAERGSKLSDELDTPHFRDERLMEFLLADEVLDVVEPLIGENIGLWSSHFICKEPYNGRATPWHEDSAYWKGEVDRCDRIVTVWLSIDRSTRENGCMRVIPGTHHGGFSEYEAVALADHTFGTQIKNMAKRERDAVYFELERGECSLHDARIIHGAAENRSPYRRCGYTMRYFSTEIRVIEERTRNHHIWLARGKDIAGNPFVNTSGR